MNTEEQSLKRKVLKVCRQIRYKKLKSIILGFIFYNEQIETICILFYKQRDLLLFAKTRFIKSLIFQIVLFLSAKPGVVLILMLLKLIQIK